MSGYNKDTTDNIMNSGIKGYYKMVDNEINGTGRINRNQEMGKI